ncbi:MAG TPA: L,D-transpeptidase family protein [Candidatus Angelobacter sp.]|nr:L,D-transpeptidase family protein [Candidatus Angelobacter sp.]
MSRVAVESGYGIHGGIIVQPGTVRKELSADRRNVIRYPAHAISDYDALMKWNLWGAVLFLALIAEHAGGSGTRQLADRILVVKSARTMKLYAGDKLIKQYKIALGTEPVGAKQQQGDHKTPEGSYVIDSRNAHSQFHLSLHISYPNTKDRERARTKAVEPGGAIMIHGLAPSFAYLGPLHRQTDWTDGCIAVTNAEIEEIWSLVPVGAKIEIQP